MRIYLIVLLLWGVVCTCPAQSCSSPSVLSGASVRHATQARQFNFGEMARRLPIQEAFPLLKPTEAPLRLPAWRAEALPFFCRIEHQWGKKMALPIKFRLGSVEYVDWLEGK